MKVWKLLLPVGLALLLAACDADNPLVLSLQPLFTESDLEFDSNLVGSWVDEKGEVNFTFEKSGETAYQLTVTELDGEKPVSGSFDAHLVRQGANLFLDFYPHSPDVGGDFYKSHLMFAHSIARVWLDGDDLSIAFFSSDWLKARIEEKSVQIDHQEAENTILLTASTGDFQELVFLNANDQHAFPEPLALRRAAARTEQQ